MQILKNLKSDQNGTIISFCFSVKMYATSTAELTSKILERRDKHDQGIYTFQGCNGVRGFRISNVLDFKIRFRLLF